MKTILILLFSLSGYGQTLPCSSVNNGSTLGGHTTWGGFTPGSATASARQDITSAPVDSHSATWMASLAGNARGAVYPVNSAIFSQNNIWEGYFIHYIDSSSQRRMPIRFPLVGKTSSKANITSGSHTLNVPGGWTAQGTSRPYFSALDLTDATSPAGIAIAVFGAGPGGGLLLTTADSLIDNYNIHLRAAASTTVTNAVVNVWGTDQYPFDSDPGTFPVPNQPLIQIGRGPNSSPYVTPVNNLFGDRFMDLYRGIPVSSQQGDQHIMVVDTKTCFGYEIFQAYNQESNTAASSYSVFDMLAGDLQRPYNLTGGASVSGMSMLNGIVKASEVLVEKVVPHAIAVSQGFNQTVNSYTGAASHAQCCGPWNSAFPPFGAKLRMKAGYDYSTFPQACWPIFVAMKKYGLLLYDGGYTADIYREVFYSWGTSTPGHPDPSGADSCPINMLTFVQTNATNFDVVQTGPIYCQDLATGCPNTLPTGSAPSISIFSASPATVGAGQPLTFSWTVSGVVDGDGNPVRTRFISYGIDPTTSCSMTGPNFCSHGPGAVDGPNHGEQVTISAPLQPGTYVFQLMVQNRFGRTTRDFTVTVV